MAAMIIIMTTSTTDFVVAAFHMPIISNRILLPPTNKLRITTARRTKWDYDYDDNATPKTTTATTTTTTTIVPMETQKRQLTREFFTIALPAFIQLAAEPLAGLVDTAYLGRLGPEVLGGAGVAISAQYAVGKLYNDPLLRTSISLVASEDGKRKLRNNNNNISDETTNDDDDNNTANINNDDNDRRALSMAVSSSMLLAFAVGSVQLVLYYLFANSILSGMGVTSTSGMYDSAFSYMRVRALGTPAATLWLVTNGIFRGLGDTATPLKYSILFTVLNAILDPIFIFTFKFGASGAAAGTAIAQYVALIPLLYSLHRRVGIDILGMYREMGKTLREYLKAGSYVFLRTVGKVLAYSVCARQAALLGPVIAAAYNLTFQLGFATTQICESVAVAVQTLLAREMAGSYDEVDECGTTKTMDMTGAAVVRAERVQHLINGSIFIGGVVAGALSLLTYFQQDSVLRGLTTNVGIRDACSAVFPVVLLTQVLKGLAYPVNGIIMGGLDWKNSMAAMWLANIVCVAMIQVWANANVMTLDKIWLALAAFMGTQVVTGVLRFQSKTGIWKMLRVEEPLIDDKDIGVKY
jgi:putative MATE family efflux protein